ncbi:TonB-linked SusC/RagA family outer membrane protein [Chitinophaga niastensis]|uniref:TonB-linked SusC/RagA family outer membrane protein n=1 Tax=Chitinophaga niastensis TaxID=536980 RepID=A0A2P8HNR6_CHINA|nr:TonB-dependent receptor [Chitinophaga niastensis]PSL47863.1 TonB-linked SusC/RagA family outer membrane protein [Chitinophaga niastensis]
MRKSIRHCQLAMRRVVRLLVLCSLVCTSFFTVQAQTPEPSLQSIVTVTGNDVSLLQIFRAIKKQTGLTLVYSNQLLNDGEKVTLNFQQTKLDDVLAFIFKNKNISYVIQRNRIVLDKKEAVHESATSIAPAEKKVDWLIRGLVMDADGNPLPGATIAVKDTKKGTVTDVMGVFSINANKDDILKVGMMGMNTEEIKVVNQKTLKVSLTAKVDKLNEVVVVGFGSQKKITVTGAVSTVNMADMQTPVRSLTNALVGKVAGVISMQSGGGEPGYDNPNFTIRGIGTFTGSASPLIIVDGVQRDDVNSSFGGAFNNIDPEDIQSISLLKDASATAVYGAKGANGVLIITTRKGVAGKPKVSAKAETGFSGLTKLPQMLDGVNYMKLYNEAQVNMGNQPVYSDETIRKTASGLDPYLYPNVNWIKTIYKDWAAMANANVNVSGGGEAMRYYVSMSFYNQDGQYKVSDIKYNPNLNFKRYDFRSNVDLNITKTTLLSLNLASMLVNSRFPGNSAKNIWYATYGTNPISFPVSYPDGKWAGPVNNGGSNPFNLVQNAGYSTEFKPSIQSVLSLNQKLDAFTEGLSATARFSFDTYGEFDNSRKGDNDLWYAPARNENGSLLYNQTRTGGTYLNYGSSSSGERMMYLEGNLSYDRSFGKHNFGGLLVGSIRNRLYGSAGDLKHSIPYRSQSGAARATYSYMDKYLAEINMGATGSENFDKGKRWGYFPAGSVGWVISKEDFFQPLAHVFNLLKIRGSYGMTGNDLIGGNDRFGYLTYYSTGASGVSFGSSGTPNYIPGIATEVIGTENLTWEKSTKTDIGLEVGLWNKLSLVVDAFQDKRSAILVPRRSISPIGGYASTSIYGNIGNMINKGIDASLEYTDHIGKDITIRLFGNVTYARNKILYADNPIAIYAYQQQEGHKFGEFYGYQSLGLFTSQADVEKSPTQSRIIYPGDVKYADLNHDGKIDGSDQTYLGKSSFPAWSYGFGFNLGYKKFELSAIFAGVADVGIMANGTDVAVDGAGAPGVGIVPFAGMGQYPASVIDDIMNRWTPEHPNQNVHYPRITVANTGDNNYVNSSWWIRDGSFMRLKQATLSYSFITPGMKRKGVSSLQVYTSTTNMLTFSKFKLWDPELGNNSAKYPYPKTVTLGVRAQF